MAGEKQTSTVSGELTQRFIEFVMMHAQNAALFLGQIPNPKTGEGEVNLELAKIFIDQLEMIQEKTRGNLSNDESTVLRNAVSNLHMVYVEVAQSSPKPTSNAPSTPVEEPPAEQPPIAGAEQTPPIASGEAGESKKKFTKSYGS
jgi:hypothetical protein